MCYNKYVPRERVQKIKLRKGCVFYDRKETNNRRKI